MSERLRVILFPPEEHKDGNHYVDHSADVNLEAAIIDLEMRGGDRVIVGTLKRVLEQLYAARAALED